MHKLALGVEYDGTFYHGWQRQKIVCTIQEEIENALSIIANHRVEIICAGRTDKGVHSTGQVIHFNTTASRKDESWILGTNSYLSKYISILWVKKVSQKFHARYSALNRSYRYMIYNKNVRSAIYANTTHHVYEKLNVKKMNDEAQYLLGEHDFISFRAANCQSFSSKRNVIALNVKRFKNLVIINITANAFLYRMVRNIVGSLITIGRSEKEDVSIQKLLNKKNSHYVGFTASAKGLSLVSVEYPLYFNLPKKIDDFFLC